MKWVMNKFQAGETDAVIGYWCKFEGVVRIADIHHYFCFGTFPFPGHPCDECHISGYPCRPFPTSPSAQDTVTSGTSCKNLCAVAGSDNAGNSQLTADNGGMTGTAALVGDNG